MGVMVLPPLSVGGPGFNVFVSGPYRLGGTLPCRGPAPLSPPPDTAQKAAVREEGGVVDRPPLVAPEFPSAVAGVPLPCRESLRGDGRVRGPFHSA
jgi:hypothetical protein